MATFIHTLAQSPDLVLITGIVLTQPQRSSAPGKESDADELAMELTFYVPWSQKNKVIRVLIVGYGPMGLALTRGLMAYPSEALIVGVFTVVKPHWHHKTIF